MYSQRRLDLLLRRYNIGRDHKWLVLRKTTIVILRRMAVVVVGGGGVVAIIWKNTAR